LKAHCTVKEISGTNDGAVQSVAVQKIAGRACRNMRTARRDNAVITCDVAEAAGLPACWIYSAIGACFPAALSDNAPMMFQVRHAGCSRSPFTRASDSVCCRPFPARLLHDDCWASGLMSLERWNVVFWLALTLVVAAPLRAQQSSLRIGYVAVP
jgi:hypothetical protein